MAKGNVAAPAATPHESEPTGRRWPKVDVVLLGWRDAPTTCAAIGALATCGYAPLRLIVVDNGSDDGADEVVWNELRRWCDRPVRIADGAVADASANGSGAAPRAVVIAGARNRGYAGGMNLGLAYAQAHQPGDYFMLLNNDVLVRPGTLEALVERCESDPTIGLCGPTQHVHDDHGRLVATVPCGFRFYPCIGFPSKLRFDARSESRPEKIERRMYGVLGGAVFGTAAYLGAIGSLDVDSFIYYEEMEMARAAQLAGFRIAWAPRATVTNVHDATMTTKGIPSRSRMAMVRYLMARARFRFTMRRYPHFLPSVALAQFAHCTYDLARGNVRETWAALLGAYDALRGQHRRFPGLGQAELPGRVLEPRGARFP